MKRKKVEGWGIQTAGGAIVRAERPSGNILTFPSRDAAVRFLKKSCWLRPYYSPVLLVPADPAKEAVYRAAMALGAWLHPDLPLRSKKTKGHLEADLRRAVERATRRGR